MASTVFDKPLNQEIEDNTQAITKNTQDISNIWSIIYPVGAIYMSATSTSPQTLFGGTWEQIKGRFMYACEDSGITAGDTGGAKSVSYTPAGSNSGGSVGNTTLTTDQIPSHNHSFTGSAVTSGGISANHTHTGTSGNPSANHTHTGPSHSHSVRGYSGYGGGAGAWIGMIAAGSGSYGGTNAAGTGASGTVSAWHTHTTTTGNQSAGHTHSVTASGSIGNKGGGKAHNHGFTNPSFTGTAATIATMPPYLAVYVWKRTA